MFVSRIKQRYKRFRKAQLSQGDILKDMDVILGCTVGGSSSIDTLEISLNYLIILSQDCDLEQDYKARKTIPVGNNDKFLQTLLVCPAYLAEKFKLGTHVDGWAMQTFESKNVSKLERNSEYPRYHYLKGDLSMGIPDLVVDFKHYLTVPRESIYKNKKLYLATLNELFRENISLRFANYLSRIGLPNI